MNYLKRKLFSYLFRDFQKELSTLKGTLSKQEEDLLLSGMWQNQVFRNYVVSQETALTIAMANDGKKPSDEEYLILYGRRMELLHLYNLARLAYNRRQVELKEKKKELKEKKKELVL